MTRVAKCRQSARKAQKKSLRNTSGQGPSTRVEASTPNANTSTKYECPICRESTRRKGMTSLPCYHVFHRTCINRWFNEDTRCPVCRKETEPAQNVAPPQDDRSGFARPLQNINFDSEGISVRLRGSNRSMIRMTNGATAWPNNTSRTGSGDISRRLDEELRRRNVDVFGRLYDVSRRLGDVCRSLNALVFRRSNATPRRVNEDYRTVDVGAMNGDSMSFPRRGNDAGSPEFRNFHICMNGVCMNIHFN